MIAMIIIGWTVMLRISGSKVAISRTVVKFREVNALRTDSPETAPGRSSHHTWRRREQRLRG